MRPICPLVVTGGHRYPLVLGLLCVLWVLHPVQAQKAQEENSGTLQVDESVQSRIGEFARQSDPRRRASALAILRQSDPDVLVSQLVYFSSRADTTRDAMAFGLIVKELHIPQRVLIEGLVPLLEIEDERIRGEAANVLSGTENRAADRRPDFSAYRAILAERVRRNEVQPLGLIRYMYRADPGQALLTMMRAHQLRRPEEIKPILWAEHVVWNVIWKQRFGFLSPEETEPIAQAELSRLAVDERWWVRLYVVEIMRQHRAFRDAEVLEPLTRDAHPLVSETAVDAAQ